MNFRNTFSYVLSTLVIIVTIMSLLAIWNVIAWEYLQEYFWKTVKSLFTICVGAVIIFVVQSLLYKKEESSQ